MNLPAHDFLDALGVSYRKMVFATTIEGGAAPVARELGFRERQMVKTLIFESADGEVVMVMLGGDQSAKSGLLKKAIGSKNIKMASRERVKSVTGYEVGSIPPFHWQPAGFRSFLEITLAGEAELGVGAGKWGYEIILTPRALIEASAASVVQLVPE